MCGSSKMVTGVWIRARTSAFLQVPAESESGYEVNIVSCYFEEWFFDSLKKPVPNSASPCCTHLKSIWKV